MRHADGDGGTETWVADNYGLKNNHELLVLTKNLISSLYKVFIQCAKNTKQVQRSTIGYGLSDSSVFYIRQLR